MVQDNINKARGLAIDGSTKLCPDFRKTLEDPFDPKVPNSVCLGCAIRMHSILKEIIELLK